MTRPEDVGFIATETLAEIGMGEDDAQARLGFDLVRDIHTRFAHAYPAFAFMRDWPVSEAHRWIVTETLKAVGSDADSEEIWRRVFTTWRNHSRNFGRAGFEHSSEVRHVA